VRNITCKVKRYKAVDPKLCENKKKPRIVRPCQRKTCANYYWKTENWSEVDIYTLTHLFLSGDSIPVMALLCVDLDICIAFRDWHIYDTLFQELNVRTFKIKPPSPTPSLSVWMNRIIKRNASLSIFRYIFLICAFVSLFICYLK